MADADSRNMPSLPLTYFRNPDVTFLARDLLGKTLFASIDGVVTGGIITETEAYAGPEDKASHAYGGRRTARTEVMFHRGGKVYVYLCYGIHHLLNIVTGDLDIPHAVLIRAICPQIGIEHMKARRKSKDLSKLSSGPGVLCQALGITREHNGLSLEGPTLWIEEGENISVDMIQQSPRIGIDYAQEWRDRPWRFSLTDLLLRINPEGS